MNGTVLALNTGSSSIKFGLYAFSGAEARLLRTGMMETIGGPVLIMRDDAGREVVRRQLADGSGHEDCLRLILETVEADLPAPLIAAGHRVVHGGDVFAEPVLVDVAVLDRLDTLVPLAPRHQPHNLAGLRALAKLYPALPQVACFDTSFHRTNPAVATSFALPRALTASGVRRYGFHGLSYEYIAGVLPAFAGAAAMGRVVVAHLGHGASMCAMREGRSVATTMGFTALDGLPMAQRCGSLDPGVILYLMQEKEMDYDGLSDLLYRHSGLLGVSGISGDVRDLLASSAAEAREALELFVYRIVRALGSLAAALRGLDLLVFTGGIGENSAEIRAEVGRGAGWLGVVLDLAANREGQGRISARDSKVGVFVIPTDENAVIVSHTLAILGEAVAGDGRDRHRSARGGGTR